MAKHESDKKKPQKLRCTQRASKKPNSLSLSLSLSLQISFSAKHEFFYHMDPPRPRRTRQTFSIPHKHEPEPSSTHTPNQRKKPGQIEEATLNRTLVKTRPWHRREQIDAKRRGAGNKTLREKKKRPEIPPQAATNLRHVSETNRLEENLAEEECRQQQR
jgi:hypothetical protein